jgi:hypothetical protein
LETLSEIRGNSRLKGQLESRPGASPCEIKEIPGAVAGGDVDAAGNDGADESHDIEERGLSAAVWPD